MDRNESVETELPVEDDVDEDWPLFRPSQRSLDLAFWRASGLSPGVARTLADAGIHTIEELRDKTRQDLFAIRGFRERALRQCEELLGRRILDRRVNDEVQFWLSNGLSLRAAAALSRANVHSLGHLVVLGRKRLLQILGFGPRDLQKCEELLGIGVPLGPWQDMGLPSRIANHLDQAGIHTLERLGAMTREELLLVPGLGESALRQCEALLGRRLASPIEDWKKRGCRWEIVARKLSRAGILTPKDLRQKSDDDLLQAGLNRDEIDKARRVCP
jgi:DNA-directed RNA polymerase alpha subunit